MDVSWCARVPRSLPPSVAQDTSLVWIFGYGSLVWRPAFEYRYVCVRSAPASFHSPCSVRGYVRGWQRRFWQGSEDHRGVPGAPGRVVTLVPHDHEHAVAHAEEWGETEEKVWGLCYGVHKDDLENVLAYLDMREKGGYERTDVPVYTDTAAGSEPTVHAMLYCATPNNEVYAGPAPLAVVAAQIARSAGPSGPNFEYLAALSLALETMEVRDPHVHALHDHAVKIMAEEKATQANGNADKKDDVSAGHVDDEAK